MSLSNFPNSIDNITDVTGISTNDELTIINTYYCKLRAGSFTDAQTYISQYPTVQAKIDDANKQNVRGDAIVAVESFLAKYNYGYGTATWDSPNSRFIVTVLPPPSALSTGMKLSVVFPQAITWGSDGTGVFVNISGMSDTKSIRTDNEPYSYGKTLLAGKYDLWYDGSKWILLNGFNKAYVDTTVTGAIAPIKAIQGIIKGDGAGNLSKATAADMPITDAGGYYNSETTEGALQEIGQIMPTVNAATDSANAAATAANAATAQANQEATAYQAATHENTVVELTDARHDNINNTDYENIGKRFDNHSSQLKDIILPENYSGAIVTFIDDDAYSDFLTKWKPIADSKGIKVDIAAVTDWVGTTGKMAVSDLQSLQGQGFEIISHTKTHPNLDNIDDTSLDNEFDMSQQWLKNNGFNGFDYVVYPYGILATDTRVKNVARKYYKLGINNAADYNPMPIDTMWLQRKDSDGCTLAQLQASLDNAITNNGWLVVLSHSYRADGDINSTGTFSLAKISQFIDYIQSKSIPIMTVSEAVRHKGNAVSIGDYANDDSVSISKNGRVKLPPNGVRIIDSGNSLMDDTITNYRPQTLTITHIYTSKDTFLGIGGVMQVFRGANNFSYALFMPWSNNAVYKRRWKESPAGWDSWEKVNASKVNVLTVGTNTMDAPITTYEVDKETIVPINTNYDNYLNVGGVMRVFRSSLNNFSYATYVPASVNALHMRKWNDGTSAWGTWTKISV